MGIEIFFAGALCALPMIWVGAVLLWVCRDPAQPEPPRTEVAPDIEMIFHEIVFRLRADDPQWLKKYDQ